MAAEHKLSPDGAVRGVWSDTFPLDDDAPRAPATPPPLPERKKRLPLPPPLPKDRLALVRPVQDRASADPASADRASAESADRAGLTDPAAAFHVEPTPLVESMVVPKPTASLPPRRLDSLPPAPGLENPFQAAAAKPEPEARISPLTAGAAGFALGVALTAAAAFGLWNFDDSPSSAPALAPMSEVTPRAEAPTAPIVAVRREPTSDRIEPEEPTADRIEPAPEAAAASDRDRAASIGASAPPRPRRPRPARPAAVEPAPPVDLPATPSREDVTRAIQAISPALRACAPEHHGHVAQLRFTFVSSGRATSALVPNDFASPTERSCVARAARGAHVPPFSRPRLAVTYPVQF